MIDDVAKQAFGAECFRCNHKADVSGFDFVHICDVRSVNLCSDCNEIVHLVASEARRKFLGLPTITEIVDERVTKMLEKENG